MKNRKRPGSFLRRLFRPCPILTEPPDLPRHIKQKAALALVLSSHEKGYSTLTPAIVLIVKEALGLCHWASKEEVKP